MQFGTEKMKIHTQQPQQKPDGNPSDINKEVKDNLDKLRKGEFVASKVTNPEDLRHFRYMCTKKFYIFKNKSR